MPLYEYECTTCHRRTEKILKFSDADLTICPHCEGPLERTLTAPNVQFKGGGWYKDLYSSAKPAANAGDSSSTPSSDPGNSSDSKPSDSKSSDSKPYDSKPSSSSDSSKSSNTSSAPSTSSPAPAPSAPAAAAKS